MKRILLLLALVPLALGSQQEALRVGSIDFFGASGENVTAVRARLPLHEGDTTTYESLDKLRPRITATLEQATGKPPTDISPVCCDKQGRLLLYLGLAGKNSREIAHLPAPAGSTCLNPGTVKLYDDAMAALMTAVQAGDSSEDDSKGYSLSHNPALRNMELKMRNYAVAHTAEVEKALRSCSRAKNRQAASEILGYANASPEQVAALVRASNDADPTVRNNSIRALAVLAGSPQPAAKQIPAQRFVAMLNSGKWEDRNKAGWLLLQLTAARDPKLLSELRAQAFDSLVEMARWQETSHAWEYRVLLGRIAGIEEKRLEQLANSGAVEEIVAAAREKH